MLTTREAAERAGLSPATIRNLCQTGELAHVRVPGRGVHGEIRIPKAALEEFLRRRRERHPRACQHVLPGGRPCNQWALQGQSYCRWHIHLHEEEGEKPPSSK